MSFFCGKYSEFLKCVENAKKQLGITYELKEKQFENCINEWPASEWTLQHLAHYLKDTEIKCKIGPKFQGVFETECLYLDVTIDDFIDWCSSKSKPSNPLHQIDRDQYFCYLDYKYMVELFSDNEEILQSIDWGVFGLTDCNGSDSTIWIGSTGCTTPCHYDTYGFNLVAQISGRKKWYLFPSSDIESLYPTRIPYEESSVFSEVNITHTDFDRHPLFKDCHPYMVILEPGDVLYVPKHWWHYVECLDTAISINTWVEMEDDKETRVKEAMTRILISSLTSGNNDSNDGLVNPTETLQSNEVNFEYFQKALENMVTSRKGETDKGQDNGTGSESLLHKNDENLVTSDANRQSADAGNSNKFQKFCDKFLSWQVHDFDGSNRISSSEKRKLDQTDFSQSEKHKSLKINKSQQNMPDNKCVNSMEKGTSYVETDSARKLSKSAKDTAQIYTVSKCSLSDLQTSEDSSQKTDITNDNTEVSNSARLRCKLIKSMLKPKVIDMILEEFNKMD